jgi:hypothetical protein
VDAASRGYDTLLVEQHDFGKGTSSRSTKLVHGGVRYLEQGAISLVMEALKERGLMRQNAPHLVTDLAFVVPNYEWWEAPFYGVGLKVYDMLAGRWLRAIADSVESRNAPRACRRSTEGLRGALSTTTASSTTRGCRSTGGDGGRPGRRHAELRAATAPARRRRSSMASSRATSKPEEPFARPRMSS